MANWHILVLCGALIIHGGNSVNATVRLINRLQSTVEANDASSESDALPENESDQWQRMLYAPQYNHTTTPAQYRYPHYAPWRNDNNNNYENSTEYPMVYINITDLFCEPEEFQHFYLEGGGRRVSMNNTWKRAKVGERADLYEVCLLPNGLPLTRACDFNYKENVTRWEDIANWSPISCLRHTREHIISVKLNTLHDQIIEGKRLRRGKQGRQEVTNLIRDILHEPDYKLLPADVLFTSNILKSVAAEAQDAELSSDVVGICSTLMSSDPQILRMSASVNATNALLEIFETYMDALSESMVPQQSCGIQPIISTNNITSSATPSQTTVESIDLSQLGVRAYLTSNVSVFYINPSCANISGIIIYDANITAHQVTQDGLLREAHGDFRYRFVYLNESVSAVMQEPGLQAATFLPASLWQHVSRFLQVRGKQALIVLKIYAHDALFVDQSSVLSCKPFSKIISISIPGYYARFPEILPFILRNGHVSKTSTAINIIGSRCGYWNYNTWVYDGVQSNTPSASQLLHDGSSVILCGTNHLTQFSFLLGGSFKQSDPNGNVLITPVHAEALDIISLVGCSLSLMGLIGIWLTAAFFKSWRAQSSTKVLLNMCLALTLQMILFVFVNTDDMSQFLIEERVYINCVALGALMQYSILVLFSWMLIVAFLQFQRYVTVIGIERPPHYILRSAIAAWGFPLIPTLLVACIDPESYIPSEYQLRTDTGVCYPSGYGLMFGVVLPVTLIVIANLAIFIYVFYSISHSLAHSMHRNEKQMIVKQIRLSVLLFFLLGLSWIFGIFAFMKAGIVFSYLFCLTATLQGFVLFVYFVILDDVTRNAWLNLICPARLQKAAKKSTEMQSMNTTSTGLENGGSNIMVP